MCKCITNIDKQLAEYNTRILLPMIGPRLPFIETMKLNEKKRGKPAKMFATFCPFCGEKYGVEKRKGALAAMSEPTDA